jgi:hypothetical protein
MHFESGDAHVHISSKKIIVQGLSVMAGWLEYFFSFLFCCF